MNLDIRVPLGMLFAILGVLLAGYGAASDSSIYQRSLGYNVNLVWGLVLLAAGFFFRRTLASIGRLFRGRSADTAPGPDPQRQEHR